MSYKNSRLRRGNVPRGHKIVKSGEGVYSKHLMESINARVDQIRAESLPPPEPTLTVDEIQTKLQEKIQSMSSKSNDQMRQLHRIFGGNINCDLDLENFKRKISRLGVGLTESQAKELFRRVDADHSGGISLQEFVNAIMPSDVSKMPWYQEKRITEQKLHRKNMISRGKVTSDMFRLNSTGNQNRPSRPVKTLCNIIYQRIVALSRRPNDQIRQIRKIFALSSDNLSASELPSAAKAKHLSMPMLRRQLAKIEVLLSDNEAKDLFNYVDADNSGSVDLQEFLVAVMPKDFSKESFWDKREEEYQRARKEQKAQMRENVSKAISEFRGNTNEELKLNEIKKILSTKVAQLAKKRSDQIRTITQMFKRADHAGDAIVNGSSKGHGSLLTREIGITTFKNHVEKLGLNLTYKQAQDLFSDFDKDNSGSISLQEFLTGVMPADYTGVSWYDSRRKHEQQQEKRKKDTAKRIGKSAFVTSQRPDLSASQCIDLIRSKIDTRSSRPSDTIRQIAQLFGASGDCDLPTFTSYIQKLGVNLTKDQALNIFKQFDTDESGTVSLLEVIVGIQQQKHLTAETSNIFARQQKAQEEKALANKKLKTSPDSRKYRAMHSSIRKTRNVNELKELITKKIEERSSKPSDQIRQIRRYFAHNRAVDTDQVDGQGVPCSNNSQGLRMDDFRKSLELFGISTNDTEIDALFKSMDADKSGDVSIQELISGCLPKHFSKVPWWEKSRARQAEIDKAAKLLERSVLYEERPSHPELSLDDIIQVIRVAVESRASRSSDAIRQMIVRLRTNSETKQVTVGMQELKQHVKSLGVILTDKQTRSLFERLDVDRSGGVDIMEFLGGMRNDYSGTTYFEKRPKSRGNQEGRSRRLGGTQFNRKGHMSGSSMTISSRPTKNPYAKWILRAPASLEESDFAEQPPGQEEKPENESIIDTQTEPAQKPKNEAESLPALTSLDGQVQQLCKQPADILISPRQKKLKKLLCKSLGVEDASKSQKMKKKRFASWQSKEKHVASPRTWTSVLRQGKQNVWRDTSDKDQLYQQHVPRRPPQKKSRVASLISPRYDPPIISRMKSRRPSAQRW